MSRFLITRTLEKGAVRKAKGWSLVKNNESLFKLESDSVSVLISTAPFLTKKDGKVTGLLRMSESDLNKSLHDNGDLSLFFQRSEVVTGNSHNLFMELSGFSGDLTQYPDLNEIQNWEPFDIYQMIAHHSPDTLAHVLIHAESEAVDALSSQLSAGLKRKLLFELEALTSAGSDPALNPHTRIRPLQDYEPALLEFRKNMGKYKLKQEQKKKQQMRQKRLHRALLSGEPGDTGEINE